MAALGEQPFVDTVSLRRDAVPFDIYPFSIPAIRNLCTLKLNPKVTFLIGENGSGKSTLLEAIAVAEGFNPEGGNRNFSFKTKDSHSELYKSIRISRGIRRARHDAFFLRAESFYNVATYMDSLGLAPTSSPYGPISGYHHELEHIDDVTPIRITVRKPPSRWQPNASGNHPRRSVPEWIIRNDQCRRRSAHGWSCESRHHQCRSWAGE